ncbi:MAG: FAD-dependent oxidoreductase [Pseudomonadota bacterium]
MSISPLLSPLRVGSVTLRNRVILPAMELTYSMDGSVTPRHLAFYRARAKGGTALAIVGGCTVEPRAGGRHMLSLKEDACIEGMRSLAGAIHDGDALAGAQLYHAGAYSHAMLSGEQAVSASAHVSAFTREESRALGRDEIPQVLDAFVAAARRAESAGFDLIEICGSAGYLVCQFLSPLINKRDDDYGGSFDNRARFGVELCQALRQSLAACTALGIRIAGNDFVPGSHTNVEAQAFAKLVAPHVDMINVTGGWHETRVPQLPADVPRGGFAYLAAGVRRVVDKPVAASNRLGDPDLAEQVLRRGLADLVCLGRPLIADPAWVDKVTRGARDEIVPCTACNQSCFDAIMKLQPVGCMVNPRAGREDETPIEPAVTARTLLVVGGGVAGCTAAITAAARGHQVTLVERDDHLGGQVAWAAIPTHKPEFPVLLRYQAAALERLGVDVQCETIADRALVERMKPDVVAVATGAAPVRPAIPGVDLPHVVQAWDVLRGEAEVGQRVVVVGGGSVGCETALWIAAEGTATPEQLAFLLFFEAESLETLRQLQRSGQREVAVVEMERRLGGDLGSRRWIVVDAMHKRGVRALKSTTVLAIEPQGVRVRKAGGDEELLACDSVVLAVGARSTADLGRALEGLPGVEIRVVGDAGAVGKIPDAIAQGFELGRTL